MVCTINITKSVYGGDGMGRLGDGRVVFVPGAFANETVKAEIVEEKRSFVKATLKEVVVPSPHRIKPDYIPTPGMVYAGLSREGELEAKGLQLKEFFERARLAGEVDIKPEFAMSPLNWRNKVVYHFDMPRNGKWRGADIAKMKLGYRIEPSHEIFDVHEDPLAAVEINRQLPAIRSRIFALLTQGAKSVRDSIEKKASVTIRYSKISGVKWWLGESGGDVTIKEMVSGKVFEVPADGFWQVNMECGQALARAVTQEYAKGAQEAPDVLDLYSGVGVFGILCKLSGAPQAATSRVAGVESGRKAVEFANRNAKNLGAEALFHCGGVAQNLRRLYITPKTCVILDPPRGGLERGVAPFLARSKARRIIYVSCDPATLVRDLRELSRAFDISSVKWFDMFPRTARFETLVALERKS